MSIVGTPVLATPSCQLPSADRAQKKVLRQANPEGKAYQQLIKTQGKQLHNCRQKNWPKTQAIWLRLYPADAKPGVIDDVLDRIVDRGYSHVFVEIFYDGRVLLPVSQNTTPWRSVTAEAVQAGQIPASTDLWQLVIRKGKERGLQVYGWLFTLNFGYSYSERPDRSAVLAKNGRGETSIAQSRFDREQAKNGRAFYMDPGEPEHLFVDPYNPQTRKELQQVVQELSKRQPDGMLFDYVRYPNTFGKTTLIDNVNQLWIFSPAAREALLSKIKEPNLQEKMVKYLESGGDNTDQKLWKLATDHAYQGILDFVQAVTSPLQQQKVPIGTVFFPGANRREGNKLDTRMQPWDRFPADWQRHPMSYGLCSDGQCVATEVARVVAASNSQTLVCPVLAGVWQKPLGGHAPLEVQMQAIQKRTPQINCLSHFVYGWIEPESDRERKLLLPSKL